MPTNEKKAEPGAEPTGTGHYVYQGSDLRAGPYPTEEDAQAFIDGHLDGNGTVAHYEAVAND